MDIRDRIRQAIAEKDGMTVRKASLDAGLSDSALHKFLTHQTRSITLDNLERLADALGVSLHWLIFDNDELESLTRAWEHIPEARREQALKVLETFAELT